MLEINGVRSLISRIRLMDFRNYEAIDLELHSGQNVFVGLNGQGKSNLLEAVYALSSTRSFRGARDKEVIRFSAEKATVTGHVGADDTEITLEYNRTGGRSAYLFENKLPRVLDLVGRLPAVVFSTTDLAIVDAGPSERRGFMDTELSLISPSYLKEFAGYRKALEQRNAALRAVREGSDQATLDPWEAALAAKGAQLRHTRSEWVSDLLPLVQREHKGLSASDDELDVHPKNVDEAETPEDLLELLKSKRSIDIASGHTTVGPHRDDLTITLAGEDARAFASQGQRRTIALALKIAVAHYLRERLNILPLVLLDDIMSDLDASRRTAVMAVSGSLGQVIMTTTDLDAIRPEVRSDARVFQVHDAQIRR
ncbi:MAG: DNA replication/repair protein RecF [Fimbriimonadales bacterium]